MTKSSRDNMLYAPPTNLVDAVIDEVALEGLDGITLEALWQRLAARLHITDEFSQSMKEQIWTICISIKDFIFYQLEEPRPPLIMFDRYEFVDPDFGTVLEPNEVPDDIYDYFPIDDPRNGIKGSCKSYHTRKQIESINNLTLESVEKNYGATLVIVGSQAIRHHALVGDSVCPTLELNVTQFCFLERVGRSRYHGEVTQGKRSLNVLREDPKTLFYHRKLLLKHKLITKQMHYQKNSGHGTSGSLLHLPRFYVERKPKMMYLAEKIIELLKTRQNNLADYTEIKKCLGLESSIKHLLKMTFFQRFVKTDLVVLYRSLYPNAKPSEWQRKNSQQEKRIRAVQLIDSSIDVDDLWIKDDAADNEESYELDTSHQLIHEPFLRQANKIIEQASYDGISQSELAIKMGITKLQSRSVFRNLNKLDMVATYMNDMGRQRLTRYVSKKFEKNSSISKQFQTEMDKMIELTKKSNEENGNKTPPTTEEFFYPPKLEDNEGDSNVLIIDEVMEIDEPVPKDNKKLFSTVNEIKKKYKLNKCGVKYRVTHHDVKNIKDLSERLNKLSTTASGNPSKRRKLNEKSDVEISTEDCRAELQETNILDDSSSEFRYSIKNLSLSDPKNTGTVTYRILKRANMLIETIKEHKVIDDMTKLMRMINEEEEREGYDVKIDKKSLIRLLQKLAADNLIKSMKLTLSANGMKKILTFICDPSINVNHPVIQSAVEQAKIKFCLLLSNKRKPPAQSPPSPTHDEAKDEANKTTYKRTNKLWTTVNSKVLPQNLVFNSRAGKKYGYSPKFIRMKVIHELLFYLIYEHPGELKLSRAQKIEELRKQSNQIDEVVESEIKEIYDTQIGWKMFVSPLPVHSSWPEGWALFSDVLLRMPLSIFLKVYSVPFIIPDMDYYTKHPIRHHYLVKDLPTPLRNVLLMKRRYIFSIHDVITRLCYIGLVQFGPQRLKDKDQVFIYLNRRSELMDTTTSALGYHHIQEIEYPITNYYFDKWQTLEKYWYDMWHICINTRLGGRLAVQGTDIILEQLGRKAEMIETLRPRIIHEAPELDLGIMPGDKKGAAGIDSAFFSHLKRNWNWENFNVGIVSTKKKDNSEKRQHNIQRKTHLSKAQNKQIIKFAEFKGLKKVTGPTQVDIKELKGKKKPQKKHSSPGDKLLRIKLIPTTKAGRKHNPIVRRVLPRKRQAHRRVKYDDIDYSALQKMNKLRVEWSPREDNILLVCKVVMMYLAPNPRSQVITFTAVRDVLRLYSSSSNNKTSRACQRRLLYIMKQPETIHSVQLGVAEIQQNYFVNKRYGDIVKKIRKANGPSECDEKVATVFKNLVAYVARKYYVISQTEFKQTKYKPNTIQEFNLVCEINHAQVPYRNLGFINDIKNTNDIHIATINSVIYSSMCCGRDRKSWAYQLFRIYQQYSEILLRNAMAKIRSDHMVSIKRNYVSAMRKYGNCLPMSSSQYQLSTSYINRFHTKLPIEMYGEIQDYFSKLLHGYHNDNLFRKGSGVQVFPPTGGMIVAILECLMQNKLNFNIEIPDHVITLLDPKLQEVDETYLRISKRYQDILESLEQNHKELEDYSEVDEIKNNVEIMRKQNKESKLNTNLSAIFNKQSAKQKSSFKREHWGWGLAKFNNKNNETVEENGETSGDLIDIENDCEFIQLQDGGVIKITKEDVKRSQSTLIDDSIHQAFLKAHAHFSDDFLDSESIKRLNEIADDVCVMEVDEESMEVDQDNSQQDKIDEISLEEMPMADKQKNSNFVNDIIENMDREIESSSRCTIKNTNSDDLQKSCTRIALLRMREELNENIQDSHHAHEYFAVNQFGIYYSLSDIDAERSKNPDFEVNEKTIDEVLSLNDDSYDRLIDDLKNFAVFPKDYPDYLRIKMNLEKEKNITGINIDSIFNYVRDKRDRGVTLRELKVVFYKKVGKQLYDILNHLMHHRLFLRTGVTEMRYIHHNFIEPWIIQSIRIMRLQREGLPTMPPGSIYVLNPQHKDNTSNDPENNSATKNDEASSISNDNNNTTNISNQKDIRKSRRTCLLQTKDIYTAAKKLDLNSAEDIHVVVRPWIQIDGVINRSVLGKMLGAVLAHCLINPGIVLTQVQSRFVPALQTYHTRELVEMLVKLQCLQFKVLSKVATNLFSNSTSIHLNYPAQMDGSSAYDNELIIEAAPGATLKLSTFLRKIQANLRTTTDSADFT